MARRNLFDRLVADTRGVSAVEFALIAPIMIAMWAAVITLSEAVMVQQRASHMTFAVGDLVAAQTTLSSGYVSNAMAAAGLIMQPMQATYSQNITEIVEQSNGTDTVVWSCGNGSLPAYATGQTVWVANNVLNAYGPGTNVIQSVAVVNFSPPLTQAFLPNGFSFTYWAYFSPRGGSSIATPPQC